MVFRGGRVGRPGLLGTMARTAVVAGTARATTNAFDRRAQRRSAEQQAYAQQQEAYAAPPPQYAPPQAAPEGDDMVAKLEKLGQLHQSGALSDEEFAAAKAQLLR
ncbi:SHOCT domain-containing protein [Nocardia sp. NPDC003345]